MEDLGLYFHIPFCRHQCGYCDFYKKNAAPSLYGEFLQALQKEVDSYQIHRDQVETLFVGGGTPSLLFDRRDFWQFLAQFGSPKESSLECNPENFDPILLEGWQAQRRRLSMGIQSLNPDVLKALDRQLDFEIVKRAIALVEKNDQQIEFSLDFIIGVNVPRDILQELRQAVDAGVDHLSIYILGLHTKHPMKNLISPEEKCAQEFLAVSDFLCDLGFEHYEVSNFARPGKKSWHNLRYWKSQDYIGFGPSAHSFFSGKRFANRSHLQAYLDSPTGCQAFCEELSEESRELEDLYLALRLKEGLCLEGRRLQKAEVLVDQGLMERREGKFCCTTKGWMVMDSLVLELSQCK